MKTMNVQLALLITKWTETITLPLGIVNVHEVADSAFVQDAPFIDQLENCQPELGIADTVIC
jgi:hypothetical protein